MHLPTNFHHPTFNRSEVIMLKNKPTSEQRDADENIHLALICYASGKVTHKWMLQKISTSLRYAMPVENKETNNQSPN